MAGVFFSIEELLISRGLVTKDQIEKFKKEANQTKQSLREVIYRSGVISEKDLLNLIGEATKIPTLDLSTYIIDEEVIKLVPEDLARKFQVIPLFKVGNSLTLAVSEPLDIFVLDEIKLKTGLEVEQVLASDREINRALEVYYKVKGASVEEISKSAVRPLKVEDLLKESSPKLKTILESTVDSPVVKIVNILLSQAIERGASDIHIEPEENRIKVRYRIDGVLYDANFLEKSLQPGITTRIKILSQMDISEQRRPQDGQFKINYENREVDVRSSTYPTVYGENLVLRLLDKSSLFIGLENLGFSKELLEEYNRQIRKPYGIVLVTGPTGSGKTTTLYATLQAINDNTKNIVTIEDPVEFKLENIRQSQVNVKAGITFANGLRAILRQDPDVIMVGEVRDLETAEIAVQAALTGHLVFSTMHTNDAPSALTRLVDMGIEPFLIASSVTTVIAQRLVRKLCQRCKKPKPLDFSSLKGFEINLEELADKTLYGPVGCDFCHQIGYSGRTGIFEMMVVNEEIKSLIIKKAPDFEIKNLLKSKYKFEDLKAAGIKKAISGITSLEEVLKVTQME